MPPTRRELLQSIADQVADYREGDVPRRTPQVVDEWVQQFPEDVQDGVLSEVNNLLGKTYISRADMTSFLQGLTAHAKFCGDDPNTFWKSANLLSIQQKGNSQREMLVMFGELLAQSIGVNLTECGSDAGPFVYIDDGLFGGGRVLQDLTSWIERKAPAEFELRIVVSVLHTLGQYYVDKKITELKAKTKKKFKVSYWRIHEIENRRYYKNASDVLWPTAIPAGPAAEAYVRYMTEEEPRYKVELRTPGSVGGKKFFSSDKARILLEQQFLTAGFEVRRRCPRLSETIRPLGATLLKTFGFGSTVVTFRNCANNCPPCLWAGDPWVPLFPRSTNSDAFLKRMIAAIRKRKVGEA